MIRYTSTIAALFIGTSAFGLCVLAPTASAHADAPDRYSLASQDLGSALRAVGRISRRDIIIAAGDVAGKISPPLNGAFTAEEAVRRLLADSGLELVVRDDTLFIGAHINRSGGTGPDLSNIIVTGSRIRGAPAASSPRSIASLSSNAR
jgi:hypothetical protein